MPRYDYTAVGHVTRDVLATGTTQPGGTALYSALQASRLSLRTLILTQGPPAELERLLGPYRDELDMTVLPAERLTTLQTRGAGATRRQRLLAWAGPIGAVEVDTAILHLAPVARETSPRWSGAAGFVGLTPQGLVRAWGPDGEVALAPLRPGLVPARCDAWVLNAAEREHCGAALTSALAAGAVVAVTDGDRPTTVCLPGGQLRVPAPPLAAPREDLGAGDVFAAAFFVALHEGRPPADAAAFAAAAAAVRLDGVGPAAIGDRAAIEARLRLGRRSHG